MAEKMTDHKFGGEWTDRKLNCLRKYLNAYRQIFTRNERARHLKTWYVDAFAGTGSRTRADVQESALFDDVYQDKDTTQYLDGSAKIALSLPEPFDYYLFIDKSKAHMSTLEQTIEQDHPTLLARCEFRQGDANSELQAWCKRRNWKKERAVVFLDPYGMQVEWATVEALAATKGIDLWYLFPLGIGVARLLTHDGEIPEAWKRKLDSLFGTDSWRTEFYREGAGQADLFGDARTNVERDAPVEKIEAFIHGRLAKAFEKAAKGLILKNSRSSPLYLLCCAASNPKGATTAIKIAQSILKED
jgi:three-Cys-motif partner protein